MEQEKPNRRTFLGWTLAAGGVLAAGDVASAASSSDRDVFLRDTMRNGPSAHLRHLAQDLLSQQYASAKALITSPEMYTEAGFDTVKWEKLAALYGGEGFNEGHYRFLKSNRNRSLFGVPDTNYDRAVKMAEAFVRNKQDYSIIFS